MDPAGTDAGAEEEKKGEEDELSEGSPYANELDDKKKRGVPMSEKEQRDYKRLKKMKKAKRENWWRRYRLGMILKIALIMILLEVKVGWFIVYVLSVGVYLVGYLDWLLEWGRENQRKYPSLQEQIAILRSLQDIRRDRERKRLDRERREGIEKARKAVEDALGVPPTTSTSSAADAKAAATDPKDVADQKDVADKRKDVPDDEDLDPVPKTMCRYWKHFLYQSVVCFFMTLIPSWNPNPEMLGMRIGKRSVRPAGAEAGGPPPAAAGGVGL